MMTIVKFGNQQPMNLVGYFLRNILQRNANKPQNISTVQKMRCRVLVKASEMKVTLIFEDGKIEIVSGSTDTFDAYVDGSLDALFQICLGKNYIQPLLTRQIKIGGNLLKLIPLLKLLRAQE